MSKNTSAIKRTQISVRNCSRNKKYKSIIKTLTKKYLDNIKSHNSDRDNTLIMLSSVYSSIDKAVKKGVLHKNNGARKKAKIARISKNIFAK